MNGFGVSMDYVEGIITSTTPYTVTRQPFVVPIYEQILAAPTLAMTSPSSFPFQHNLDFNQFRYGGNGNYAITDAPVFFPLGYIPRSLLFCFVCVVGATHSRKDSGVKRVTMRKHRLGLLLLLLLVGCMEDVTAL